MKTEVEGVVTGISENSNSNQKTVVITLVPATPADVANKVPGTPAKTLQLLTNDAENLDFFARGKKVKVSFSEA